MYLCTSYVCIYTCMCVCKYSDRLDLLSLVSGLLWLNVVLLLCLVPTVGTDLVTSLPYYALSLLMSGISVTSCRFPKTFLFPPELL